ncbi:unnamed protein product [Miscanthus lutarioriparius]|uniref:Uncharacterized protein n=1 Tax=Miscanthus lutarioriparius TaxID=422564 RepID=A0A811R7Z7_9POAL|nr:unnamed protein product [Miscanthus lutarioriparius]
MSSKTDNLIANFTQQSTKCNQMNLSLQKVMEESDLLHKRYNEVFMHPNLFWAPKLKQEEKEVAVNRILQFERQVYEKQKLELDIEQLKGKLEVVKHIEGEGVVKKCSEELTSELNERIEEMEHLEDLNQTLVVKARMASDEI